MRFAKTEWWINSIRVNKSFKHNSKYLVLMNRTNPIHIK